jgi:hypothetical protein
MSLRGGPRSGPTTLAPHASAGEQSPRNDICEHSDFGDSQQDHSNPIDDSTNGNASQGDNPTRQATRSLDPKPQTDSHSQRRDRASGETAHNITSFYAS